VNSTVVVVGGGLACKENPGRSGICQRFGQIREGNAKKVTVCLTVAVGPLKKIESLEMSKKVEPKTEMN